MGPGLLRKAKNGAFSRVEAAALRKEAETSQVTKAVFQSLLCYFSRLQLCLDASKPGPGQLKGTLEVSARGAILDPRSSGLLHSAE